jgi:hypothetical protein
MLMFYWPPLPVYEGRGWQPPPNVHATPEFLQLLEGIGMRPWAEPLADRLGAVHVLHIQRLSDEDLWSTGMRQVQVRKLRAATGPPAPEVGIPVQSTAFPVSCGALPDGACGPKQPVSRSKAERVRRGRRSDEDKIYCFHAAEGRVPEVIVRSRVHVAEAALQSPLVSAAASSNRGPATAAAEAAKMVEAAHEAQTTASNALAHALAIGGADDVEEHIKYAQECLNLTNGEQPKMAASALNATSQALASCLPGKLNAALGVAEICVRDNLIWRTQLRCPLGDRCSFVASLMKSVDGLVDGEGNVDSDKFSHLMHSHSREVCSRFPSSAFLSNAAHEAIKRKGPRPQRRGQGARHGVAAAWLKSGLRLLTTKKKTVSSCRANSDTDVCLESTEATGRQGAAATGNIDTHMMHGPQTFVHKSGDYYSILDDEQAKPEQRKADDGVWYTWLHFHEWYGHGAWNMWATAAAF